MLNTNGSFFYKMPNLGFCADINSFKAIIIDQGAFDENTADIQAYFNSLLEYAKQGGNLIIFPQKNETGLASALNSELETFSHMPDRISFDEVKYGMGKVCFCRDCSSLKLSGFFKD